MSFDEDFNVEYRYCNGSEVTVQDTKEDITITLPVNDTKVQIGIARLVQIGTYWYRLR